jgi:trk system potassium uptake protein TrkH
MNYEFSHREIYIFIFFSWILISLFGIVPYILSDSINSFTSAFFESVSGFTTTGSTTLISIENYPKSILLWRSLSQWLGGFYYLILSLSILPIFGLGGMLLYKPDIQLLNFNDIKEKVIDVFKKIIIIYCGFTVLESLILYFAGMNVFDAICHTFSTISTGGFSTRNNNIAAFNSPMIELIIIIFMIISGVNFLFIWRATKNDYKRLLRDQEFHFYLLLIFCAALIVTILIYLQNNAEFLTSLRYSFFQVASILSTTGFYNHNYLNWSPVITLIFFGLMFIGGTTGSTAGSIKTLRVYLLLKDSILEFKRIIHPNAVIPLRFNNKNVNSEIITNFQIFVILYIFLIIISTIIISATGIDFKTSLGATVSSIGNIGISFGQLGPGLNVAILHPLAKWVLIFLMILGRIEIFALLVILLPSFWKR